MTFCIMCSIDAHYSWTVLESGSNVTLRGVDFLNVQNGIVVGDSGTILLTNNGGLSWKKMFSGVEEQLNSVSYIDEYRVIVVGNNGLILNSSDRGLTWITQNKNNIKSDFLSVDVSPSGKGIIAGKRECILTTQDCGQSWSVLEDNGIGNFSSARILDEENAFVFGTSSIGHNVICHIVHFDSLADKQEYLVFNNDYYSAGTVSDGFAVNQNSIITLGAVSTSEDQMPMSYITCNDKWVTDFWLPEISHDSSYYTAIDMVDNYGLAIGNHIMEYPGEIYHHIMSVTNDYGKSWYTVEMPRFNSILYDLKLVADVAYIIGSNGFILKTENIPSEVNIQ